jgi:hypothetical protein
MHLDTSGIEVQIRAREGELMRLAAEPARPGKVVQHAPRETWAQRWARSAWDGRNKLLLETGIRTEAARLADGTVKIEISSSRNAEGVLPGTREHPLHPGGAPG